MVTFSYLAQGRDGYQLLTIVLTKNKVLMKNKVLTKKGEVPHASCMQTQILKKTSVSAVREKPNCKSNTEECRVISIRVSLLHIQTHYGRHLF